MNNGFRNGFRRELRQMSSRPAYLVGMMLIPIFIALFFVSLLGNGMPSRVPTAVVDMDQSSMSRQVRRNLASTQMLDITYDVESYDAAMELVRRGEIYGFFVIPEDFERDALSQRHPTLEYFSNMTYFIPGTFSFKGFKTIAVTTSAGVARAKIVSLGLDGEQAIEVMQPVVIDTIGLNNPWMNYAYYMAPSFTMASLVLMIMIMTVMAVTNEIKYGTSIEWLATNNYRMWMALVSKLLPHTLVYWSVGLLILGIWFGWQHFPMNGSLGMMILATLLLVVASQAFAVFVVEILPNPRLAYSTISLFGVLSYSFTGFSMPIENMYGAIAAFSWLAPVRYWYLIFVDNALNGVAIYYSRWFFVSLLLFTLLPLLLLRRLRKAMLTPVYVP